MGSGSDPGLLQGITFTLLLGIAGFFILLAGQRHRPTLHFQTRLFLVALVLRFALSIAIYQFGLVRYVGDEDASGWGLGADLSREWATRGASLFDLPFRMAEGFGQHHRGYYYLLGGFFFVTDSPFRLVAAALNCFFGALTVVFAYRVARTLFTDWVAARVGWWTCLFPSMLIWSAMTVKEPVVILLETAALYGCVRLREIGVSPRHLLLCAACIVLLIPFRFYAAYLVGLAVVLSLVAGDLFRPQRAFSAVLLGALVIPLLLGTARLATRERKYDLDYVQSFRKNVATGGARVGAQSGVQTDYDMRTPVGFGLGTAVGAAHLLLAPFPWQLRGSVRMLATAPELLYWWWLVFAGVIPGLLYAVKRRLPDVVSTLVFLAGFGLLYSMMFGNVGLIFRQRAQLLPWLLIFAAVGLEQRMLRRQAQTRRAAAPPYPMPAVPTPIPPSATQAPNG